MASRVGLSKVSFGKCLDQAAGVEERIASVNGLDSRRTGRATLFDLIV